jgi:5-methylcytosine-specific restriction endonuclease McrA
MARDKRPEGPCCLCGTVGPLSFEHVPPQSAFNDSSVFLAEVKRLLGRDWWADSDDEIEGRTQQRGAGQYTLCEACNNKTGGWYVPDYVRLARAAMPALSVAKAGDVVGIPVDIRPLRVLKQILVMFCSACGPNFVFPEMARYLLNRESRQLPPGHDVYLGLFDRRSRASRQAGLTGRLSLTGPSHSYSEISFPPLLLVMSVHSPSPDSRLTRVTWFNEYAWADRWQGTVLLDCLQVNTHLPGTYTTREEIEENRARRLSTTG